jgi:hypothetical protein
MTNGFQPQEIFVLYCISGNIDKLREYYGSNKDRIDISANNEEAFRWSCYNGHLSIAKWLLNIKPTIDISANNDQAFLWACSEGRLLILEWLLSINPSITISVQKEKAFTYACYRGQLDVAKWLLEVIPSIDITAENHFAIKCATTYKHFSIVQWLSDLYITRNIRNWLFNYLENNDLSIQCLICHDYQATYVKSQCGHTYCRECITRWLIQNNTCPYCRNNI